MKDNNLKGLEVIGQEVEELTNIIKSVEMRLESIKTAIGTIVGDPLKLSYGYSQSLGNGQAYKTEIAMSRECTLSEALFILPHCYGVDPTTISVKGRRIGEDHSAKVKSIEVIESWGRKEYIVTTEHNERE
jgi:hypothetical protein